MDNYLIVELDKDYRVISRTFTKKFTNKKEAEKWCKDNSWSGYSYFCFETAELKDKGYYYGY